MPARNHKALLALVSGRMNTPVAFGEHDCVLFANAAAQAQTGRDLLAELEIDPDWTDQDAAARAIARAGGLGTALDKVLKPIPISMAQRGDLVIVPSPTGPALGVMLGAVIVAPGVKGLLHLPRKEALLAWSLG